MCHSQNRNIKKICSAKEGVAKAMNLIFPSFCDTLFPCYLEGSDCFTGSLLGSPCRPPEALPVCRTDKSRPPPDSRNFVQQSKRVRVFFDRICVFFHFDGIQSTAFLNQQIDLVHVFVPVKIQRRFQNPFVVRP